MTAPDYVVPAPTGWWVKAPLGLLNYSDDFNRAVLGPDWVQRNGTYSMVLRDNDIAYCADTAEDSTAVISWVHHLNVDDIMVKGVTAERSNVNTNVALGIGGADKVGWANTSNNVYYSLHTSTNWDWWGTGIIMREEDPFADFTAGLDVMLSLERIGTMFVVRANGFIYQYWDDVNGYVPLDDTHRYVMCGVTHPQAGSNAGGWTLFGVTETPQSRPNWLMADWGGYSDDFNRDDGDQLSSWWVDETSPTTRLGLSDHQLFLPDGAEAFAQERWPVATCFADVEVTATIAVAPDAHDLIMLTLASAADTGKIVAAFIYPGLFCIRTSTDPVRWTTDQTTRSDEYNGTVSDGDVFTFRRVGSVYILEQNGTQRCEWDDSGGYMPIDQFHVWQKISMYRDTSGPSTGRLDNWSWSELDSDRIMPAGFAYARSLELTRAVNAAITVGARTNQNITASITAAADIGVNAEVSTPFHVVQEYFHDGGTIATTQTADLQFDAASFKAVLTSGESTYLSNNNAIFIYFCLPQDLIRSAVSTYYPQTLDEDYPDTMSDLVATHGINTMYLFAMPEWDNDPGNNGWAQNRFSEAGVGGDRPDLPTGLTRQEAYDQWMHFYRDDNHDSNTNHHQLGQLLNDDYVTRGYKIQANCANAGSCFYAYEMGVDQVTLQRVNDDISGLIGSVGFIRGAGRQYSKEWGWDVSGWRTYFGNGGPTYDGGHNLTAGWSESMFTRSYYLMFYSGADVIMEEAHDYTTGGWIDINGTDYTPFGTALRDFCDFAFTRHPERGVPHVPVAIMKDHISFWEPLFGQYAQNRAVWYQQISANNGEKMLYNLWEWIYPNYNDWGTSLTAAEPMGSATWGEQFDVLTEQAGIDALNKYNAVILATDAVVDTTLQSKLAAFANNGGVVVINAQQLSGSAHETLTGVTLTGTSSTSDDITWEPDSEVIAESSFNYSTCTLGTATSLAHSGTSTVQVCSNAVGTGEVWTVMPDYMSNPDNDAVMGIANKIIDALIARFVAAWITGGNHADIDYTINTGAGPNGTTKVVTIINNHASTTWTGTVNFDGTPTPVKEWIADADPSYTTNDGNTQVSASVPAGDVKVYAVG